MLIKEAVEWAQLNCVRMELLLTADGLALVFTKDDYVFYMTLEDQIARNFLNKYFCPAIEDIKRNNG